MSQEELEGMEGGMGAPSRERAGRVPGPRKEGDAAGTVPSPEAAAKSQAFFPFPYFRHTGPECSSCRQGLIVRLGLGLAAG